MGVGELERRSGSRLVMSAAVAALGLVALVTTVAQASSSPVRAGRSGLAGVQLEDVARQVGLDFRQGAFRFGVSPDPAAR